MIAQKLNLRLFCECVKGLYSLLWIFADEHQEALCRPLAVGLAFGHDVEGKALYRGGRGGGRGNDKVGRSVSN